MDGEVKKPSFLVYYDNEVIVLRLQDEEAGKLFKSLFPYGREEIRPDFDRNPALAMAFDILSMAIDRDKEKYINRCEANRENGRKGGLAKARNGKQSLPNGKQGLANLADKDMDKDRDKERDKDINSFCTEPEESVSMPPVISIILNDKSLHDIFQSDIDGWKELYPAVDILQELRKMKGWLDSNPAKRKTQRGIKRFINGWLAREQDRSGTTADRDGTDGAGIKRFISGKSNEELEKGIHDIVTSRISQEALDRYHDKIHELIRLCCPFEIFTQEQIDYMQREWKMEPLHKDNAYVVPRADIYDFYDRKLGITEDTGID